MFIIIYIIYNFTFLFPRSSDCNDDSENSKCMF